MKVEIIVTDDNTFNLGWLLFVLGQERPPEPTADADGFVWDHSRDGWDMGKQTGGMLEQVRNVFARQPMLDKPQYIINVEAPAVVVNDQNVVVTNVGPDQQGTAQEIAKQH